MPAMVPQAPASRVAGKGARWVCLSNRQTARSARRCCAARYRIRRNLWISGWDGVRFWGFCGLEARLHLGIQDGHAIWKSGKFPAWCGSPSCPLPLRFARLAFRNLNLPTKQANRPQRPPILRSVLSNQEKSMDKWHCFGVEKATFAAWGMGGFGLGAGGAAMWAGA